MYLDAFKKFSQPANAFFCLAMSLALSPQLFGQSPTSYSGIFPHTAVTNTHLEVGIGSVIKRGNTLWYNSYGPHITTGGTDELYSIDLTTMTRTTHSAYPGNTDANRYRSSHLGIDIIGAAYIDSANTVRYLPVTNSTAGSGHLVGRLTGTAAHLTNPNKVYYMTMEEGLYEVDFTNLSSPTVNTLRIDQNFTAPGQYNLPGNHGKGLYTGQNRMYYTNNGASGGAGVLAEWDGISDPKLQASWRIVDSTRQYTEVTSRRGSVDMVANSTDAIWAVGWDQESALINVRNAADGNWTRFRFAKGSYTHDHPNGWYTEWPRIQNVGLSEGLLMSDHGSMFAVPETFSATNYGGLKPINNHHKMVVDYADAGDRIVFGANDSSQFDNPLVQRANSNLMFVNKDSLGDYGGAPNGYGGVWLNDTVNANASSDAFLINGYKNRVVHFEHENSGPASFRIEVDQNGTGNWTSLSTVTVPGTSGLGYNHYIIPQNVTAQWMRVVPLQTTSSASAYLHLTNTARPKDQALTASLAPAGQTQSMSRGVLRTMTGNDHKLEFAADIYDSNGLKTTGYYQAQVNASNQLELVRVNNAAAESSLRTAAATTLDYGVDAASVFIDNGGTRFRLPKGNLAFDSTTDSGARRGIREVVTERSLMNIHGTFYERPRDFTGGGIRRILPIATHNQEIHDFASWRGMLVMSGVVAGGAANDGHYVQSDDGKVGLWFGNVDDLYKFGAPVGVGGPWKDTAVTANVASDPYLMAGYEQKLLELSHTLNSSVTFTLEIDFSGTNQWERFGTFTVASGQTLSYVFDEGFSAHWIRLVSNQNTTATAWFTYSATVVPEPNALSLSGLLAILGIANRRRR